MKMHYDGTITNFIVNTIPELIGNHFPIVKFINNWKGKNSEIKIVCGNKLSKNIKKSDILINNNIIIIVGKC